MLHTGKTERVLGLWATFVAGTLIFIVRKNQDISQSSYSHYIVGTSRLEAADDQVKSQRPI